jgi:hypothetical protein
MNATTKTTTDEEALINLLNECDDEEMLILDVKNYAWVNASEFKINSSKN